MTRTRSWIACEFAQDYKSIIYCLHLFSLFKRNKKKKKEWLSIMSFNQYQIAVKMINELIFENIFFYI